MSTHSPKLSLSQAAAPSPNSRPRTSLQRLAWSVATTAAAALLLLLLQTQHALPPFLTPVHAASVLRHPATHPMSRSTGFWHTDRDRILDQGNHAVRIAGVNWSGLETREAIPGGLEVRDYRAILRTVQQSGYNVVRIPFSNEMVEAPAVPDHIRFDSAAGPINTDLRDLNSLEILDKIVTYCGEIGLKVILDNHRSEAGSSAEESGLWYTQQYPETSWLADWEILARRYTDNSTVIGMDLRNEPHNADKGGACWDCGGQNDWHRAAQRAGNTILAINPRLLIFVEGVDTYAGDSYWWGGNLEGVRTSPVRLSVPNHLVYSAHEYGPSEYSQPWFHEQTSPATLASIWRQHWAFISENGIAPVWIGEFGTSNRDDDVRSSRPGSEGQWFASLVTFLGSHPAVGWTYWGINGEDRYGLLDAAYSNHPANDKKSMALASITAPGSEDQVYAGAHAETHDLPAATINPYSPSHAAFARMQDQRTARSAQLLTAPSKSHSPGLDERAAQDVQRAIAASVHTAVSAATGKLSE